jgi:hypothetical protein
MNGIKIFEQMKQVSCLTKLLQLEKNSGKRGKMFEIVSNIITRFGFCSLFTNDTYDHYEGNINTCKLKKVNNLIQYLKNLSSSKSGSSDITLKNKNTDEYIFISCKFYDDDNNKYIKDYEVQDIQSAIFKNSHVYKKYKIYLFVNNKEKVLQIKNSCEKTNEHLKDDITDIIGIEEFEKYFKNFKNSVQDVSMEDINSVFCNTQIPLELRFHQDMITYKMMKKIDEGEKDLLLGAKPRSGKTYCVGGLFKKYYKKNASLNALVITPAPNETLSQFTDDLFHKFIDFIGINIVEIKKGTDFQTMNLQENNIVILSKQLLDDYVLEKKIGEIQNLNLDFIVFDENHFHGTTQMSKNILESYSSEKTIKVYLTATYAKPLNEWSIPLECQFYWDIEDEQLCKKRNIQGLVDKYGEDVLFFLTEENKEYNLKIYDNMPDLEVITNMMDMEKYQIIKERIKDTSYGFSMTTLLCGNFPNEVDMMLRYISGSNKEEDYPKKNLSIFERIRKMAIKSNSRTKLNNGDFTSQLWFLPYGKEMHIDSVSEHLKDRMLNNKILSKYEIKIVNSKKEYKLKEIKEEIKNWEIKAKEDGKDGLILLAGNQLTLGITLPFVDVVFLLNDTISSDKIFQMMYRSMTESINNAENNKINKGVKKMGFVVDLNISRVLNTSLDYNVYKKNLNVEQKISYLIENNLINIDSDLFENKESKTKLVENLLAIWKANPSNNLKILLRKIEDMIIDLDTTDQKIANYYFTSSVDDKKLNVKIRVDEENIQDLQSGREVIKNSSEEAVDVENICEEEKKINENISITKDVLPFIVPLSCILTYGKKHGEILDIIEMIEIIKNDQTLLNVFNDQTFIWWNKKDVIDIVKDIITKYVKSNSSVYNITIQFKMSLQNLIDNPKELLEMINSCLKPKQKEKQENGEVFTPMKTIFELLDNLDKHYVLKHNRSIFTELNFKWFDPASGMGNFPVAVYLKLMEGLKSQITDDEERKKHIIENMLFMSELNKKNVFICHQIFNINNKYKLNLYEGDTLLLDIGNEWNLGKNSFDVILGNPPYNKGGIWSHTKKTDSEKREVLWMTFIKKSFDYLKPNGFLVFITPLYWLKINIEVHNDMLEKHIVWLKLWDDSQSKSMINADIPISLFILENEMNTSNKKTEIISEIKRKKLTTKSYEYLNKNYSIPLAFHSIFNKLSQFIEKNNCSLEYKTKMVKSTGVKEKVPAIYTLEDMYAVDTYTLNEGILVKKALEQHPDANKRKLIIANKRGFKGAFIDEGKLSLTGCNKFYILGNNLELIKKMMGFNISVFISDYPKYSQSFLDKEAFKYFPDLRKLGVEDITEDEFYHLIGLSEQEINQVYHPSSNEDEVEPKVKSVRAKRNLIIEEDEDEEDL